MKSLEEQLLPAVVSVEEPVLDENMEVRDTRPQGSGFLIGIDQGWRNPDNGAIQCHTFLITADHVLAAAAHPSRPLYVKMNQTGGLLSAKGPPPASNGWTRNASRDVAVSPFHFQRMTHEGARFRVIEDGELLPTTLMHQTGLGVGDRVLVAGFPLGVVGTSRLNAIVRGGTIARLDDDLLSEQDAFMIDVHVFPGSSGGPVYLPIDGADVGALVGMVTRYVPFAETGENSGLAYVVPAETIAMRPVPPKPDDE